MLTFLISALLVLLPAYLVRFKIGPLPTTVLEILLLAIVLVWLAQNWRSLGAKIKFWFARSPWTNFNVWAIVWVIAALLAAGVSHFSLASLGIWRAYFLEPVILFFIIQDVYKDKNKNGLIWPLVLSALAVAVYAVWQKVTGMGIATGFCDVSTDCRATSFYGYPNAIGLYLEIIICLLVGLFFTIKDKYGRWCLIGALLLAVDGIFAARSRGALMGLTFGLGVFFLAYSKLTRKIIIGLAVLAVLVIVAVAPLRQTAIKDLQLQDFSGQIRLQEWSETWRMLSSGRLLTGAGLANYQASIKPFHIGGLFFNFTNDPNYLQKITTEPTKYKSIFWRNIEIFLYPHNFILNFWSETGLLGLVLFILLVTLFFIVAIKHYKSLLTKNGSNKYLILGAIAAMITLIIHGLVDVPYFKNDLAILFWLLFIFI